MYRISTQKNNKVYHPVHFLRLYSLGEESGKQIYEGLIVRIEAYSWRKNNSGKNHWDIFYVFPNGDAVIRTAIKGCDWKGTAWDSATILTCYGGEDEIVVKVVKVDTPLGAEDMEVPLKFEGVLFKDATNQEKQHAARFALDAVEEGFGPHGEIKNVPSLGGWAKEVLEEDKD